MKKTLLTALITALPLMAVAAINNNPLATTRPAGVTPNISQQRMQNQMQMQQQQEQMKLRNDQQMESQALQQKIRQQQQRSQQRINNSQP
ncbi:DUF2756 domain-containing protein [Tatumella citrea]|uniref:DUF2756 domain-containing protein n=1 Tax=Tatumella citrea TaxID=53336 RepID=A0A1Y0L2X8_TATCI|nr:DUF2756 domain-containing protein [Tatumella citrea]ARU92357.1 hypothetical protein A7K98_00220 [Tatumella citrea]ARU96392.1 hypothetical protein A7K99_00220 [Tatumella citrea]